MLSSKQKKCLRSLAIFDHHFQEKPGRAYTILEKVNISTDTHVKEEVAFHIPDYQQLYDIMIDEIKGAGFKHVTKASPKDANIILRTYVKKNVEHDGWYYFFYGACIYAKGGLWYYTKSRYNNDKLMFDPMEFSVGLWLCQDDQLEVECNFADFYLKVKK